MRQYSQPSNPSTNSIIQGRARIGSKRSRSDMVGCVRIDGVGDEIPFVAIRGYDRAEAGLWQKPRVFRLKGWGCLIVEGSEIADSLKDSS